jgi:hypothetical protein
MNKILLLAFLIAATALAFSASSARAACNSICRTKCDATWRGSYPNVQECYKWWARANECPEYARAQAAANRANDWRYTKVAVPASCGRWRPPRGGIRR